jgi:hypothetical protein
MKVEETVKRVIISILFVLYVIWIVFISWNAVYNKFVTVPEVILLTAISFIICQAVALGTQWPAAYVPMTIVIVLVETGLGITYLAAHTDFLAASAILNPLFHGYVLSLFVRYFLFRRNLYKSIIVKDKRKIEGFGS